MSKKTENSLKTNFKAVLSFFIPELCFYLDFQKAAENRISIEKSSKRPNNISRESTILPTIVTSAQCAIVEPKPGPTPPIHEATMPAEATKSSPVNNNIKVLTHQVSKYIKKNAKVRYIKSSGTLFPLSFT